MANVREVPVILYSNGLNPDACTKAVNLGAAGCVRKAADIPKLSNVIRKVLAREENKVFMEI